MRSYTDYPFRSNYLDLQGIRLHYIDEGPRNGGAGTVLMLHGNPTWSYYYRRLISALAPTHRVIVPDHIGMGLSDKPTDAQYPHTLSRRIADVERLVESLAINGPLTLVMHDWGGMIGMGYASRHVEKIARLVVLNTGAFHLPAEKRLPWQIRLARVPGLGAVLIRGLNAFSRGAVSTCVTRKPLESDEAAALCDPYDSWRHRRAVHRFIQDIPLKRGDRGFDLIEEIEAGLGRFARVPVPMCWGMRDFVFDEHFLRRWMDFFPAARVHRFEDSGHYVLEDSHDRIIPLVREFLMAQAPVEAAFA